MRLTGSRAYYRSTPPKLPTGLVELIEGLTRDVLKNNPSDIYGFCANHMHQLLEIRDGPIPKKPLTLEEKIARAQEKVRQRAEQRWQQYVMNLREHRGAQEPEIKPTATEDGTSSIISQEPTAANVPVNNEHELVGTNFLETGQPPREDLTQQNIDELEKKLDDDLKKETEYDSEIIPVTESTNAASDITPTEHFPSNSSPKDEDVESEAHDGTVETTGKTINDLDVIDKGQITQSEKGLKGSSELATETKTSLQGPDMDFKNRQDSSTINSLIMNQGSVLFDSVRKIIEDSIMVTENTSENKLVEQTSPTPTVDVKNATEPQSDKIMSSLNSEEPEQSSDNVIDPDTTNSSNAVNNAELTNSVNNNENEDPQETKIIDIPFKESPTVELQDPIINSDTLESLPETNKDSDIVTLITQDSTNNEFEQNSSKNDSLNAMDSNNSTDLLQDTKNHSDSTKSAADPQLQRHQNEIDVELIENTNKKNIQNGNQSFDTSKLDESMQIHGQDTNMDLETAAITIQKVFRSFLFKSRASTFDDTGNDDAIFLNEDDKNKAECDFPVTGSINERRPHGLTRMDTVLQTVNEEKSLSLSTDDSSTLSSAATVIQAHVRGFLVRNKLNSNKTISTNSLAASNSNEPSLTSLEMDNEQNKNKTVLNIHIVPEGGNYLSRDESLITSMDLSLDSSPPSSINLHPLGYDKSERRKQLKREDAIQSISPPSNNSGKLSEDVDSVKELPFNDHEVTDGHKSEDNNVVKDDLQEGGLVSENVKIPSEDNVASEAVTIVEQKQSLVQMISDEMDVVTPFTRNDDNNASDKKLMHSGEFHDAVLPTKVSRSDTSVTSEFKNVLVYFLLWNHS